MLKVNPMHLDSVDPGDLFAGIAHLPRIGLAVSGGPDSLALLLLVRGWCDGLGATAPDVFVYSVDHGLRPEAAGEAEFVVDTAKSLGFSGRKLVWTGDKPKTGVQAAARVARYRLMGTAMIEDGVPALITAHHADDQAETVLMRMAHGSGITGLGGMAGWSSVEDVPVHRPLLGCRRDQLQQIVTRNGISPVEDASNGDPHYERVRWRQAAPGLAKHGLTAAGLGRMGRRMQRAEAALTHAADAAFSAHVTCDPFGVAHLPIAAFSALPDEIRLRVMAQMFVAAGRETPRLAQLEDLVLALGHSEFSDTCLSGAQIAQHHKAILIFAEIGRLQMPRTDIAPGATLVWDGRFAITNAGSAPLAVQDSRHLTRADAEKFVGGKIDLPMAAVTAAPSVIGANCDRIALGLFTRSQQVQVSLADGVKA